MIYKFFFVIIFGLLVLSCGKTDKDIPKSDINSETVIDTIPMTPAESFAYSLVNDILNEDDEDLQSYLAEDLYPLLSKSPKVTMDKISSSLYILEYEENGTDKAFIIQKCFSPLKDEIVYVRKETSLNAIKQFLK